MEPNSVIALVVLILGVIVEGLRRKWKSNDDAKVKEAEFVEQRKKAIEEGDRFNQYNR